LSHSNRAICTGDKPIEDEKLAARKRSLLVDPAVRRVIEVKVIEAKSHEAPEPSREATATTFVISFAHPHRPI